MQTDDDIPRPPPPMPDEGQEIGADDGVPLEPLGGDESPPEPEVGRVVRPMSRVPVYRTAKKRHPGVAAPDSLVDSLPKSLEEQIYSLPWEEVKRHMAGLNLKRRRRLLALLSSTFSQKDMCEKLGISRQTILRACMENPDVIQIARIARNSGIASIAERKVIQLISTMDVEKVPHDRRARAAKDLIDVAEVAGKVAAPRQAGERDEDTMELVFRVKRKMLQNRRDDRGDDDGGDVRTVEGKFEEIAEGQK